MLVDWSYPLRLSSRYMAFCRARNCWSLVLFWLIQLVTRSFQLVTLGLTTVPCISCLPDGCQAL